MEWAGSGDNQLLMKDVETWAVGKKGSPPGDSFFDIYIFPASPDLTKKQSPPGILFVIFLFFPPPARPDPMFNT